MEIIQDDLLTGCILEKEDPRDFLVDDWEAGSTETKYPLEINNLDKATLLRQEGVTCTAQGLTNCLEIEIFKVYGQRVSLDADWQWVNQSRIPLPTKTVNGDRLTSAIEAAMIFGVKVKEVHTEGVLQVGDIVRLEGYAKVNKDIDSIKQVLAQGKAIYTACNTTKPMEKGKESWTTWTYARNEGFINLRGISVGGHAFVIGGYDIRNNGIEGNSYGENWGHYGDGSFRNYEEQLTSFATMYVFYLKQDQKINSAQKARGIRLMKTIWTLANKIWEDKDFNPVDEEMQLLKKTAHKAKEIINKLG